MKTYIAKKPFNHDQLGRISKDQKFEATDAQIAPVKRFVEEYEMKVEQYAPFTKAPALHSSASPAGQALQQTTAKQSDSGGKRGRQKKSGE